MFCLNFYRAATQSITIDEAFTYEQFVSKPFGGLLEPFDANNHVLNSMLAWLAIAMFGLSEWSLRLPSVIGGAIYLLVAYRLSFGLFSRSLWSLTTTALLVTNPFLQDHLSAARGYGLALALVMARLLELIRTTGSPETRSLYPAGICFGLSIAANLTSLFPVVALTMSFFAVNRVLGRLRDKALWVELIVPSILLAFVPLVLPLSKAEPKDFYFGAKRLVDTVQSLASLSFAHGEPGPHWLHALSYCLRLSMAAALPCALLLVAACLACGSWVLWNLHRGPSWRSELDTPLGFLTLSSVAVVGLVIAAHYLLHVLYPLSRTALYFVPLAFLAASLILYRFRQSKPISLFAGAAAALCLVSFLSQTTVSYYAEWTFDAGTKRIVNFIRSKHPPQKHLTIRASWSLGPSLNFYERLYGLNWEPVDRRGPKADGDVIVLRSEDKELVKSMRLHVMYRDPGSAAIVAVP